MCVKADLSFAVSLAIIDFYHNQKGSEGLQPGCCSFLPFFENIDGFAYLFTECPWTTGIAEGSVHTREVNNMSPLWDLL